MPNILKKNNNSCERGYILFLFASVLTLIVPVIIAGALLKFDKNNKVNICSFYNNLREIATALDAFYQNTGRYPCPAQNIKENLEPSVCREFTGFIPYKNLGLQKKQALTRKRENIIYKVSPNKVNPALSYAHPQVDGKNSSFVLIFPIKHCVLEKIKENPALSTEKNDDYILMYKDLNPLENKKN
jgi:hypothetical protein